MWSQAIWDECVEAMDTDNFGAVVQRLLAEHPSLTQGKDSYGITILHYAAAKGDTVTCKLLLAAGASK